MNLKDLHFTRLNLVQPLRYLRDDSLNPFDGSVSALPAGGWEVMFNMIIDSERGQNFDAPPGNRYFAALINAGRAPLEEMSRPAESGAAHPVPAETEAQEALYLPSGLYFFTQTREFLHEADLTDMALELQREGLWQRLEMENRIYIRYLYEDSSAVTQLFRPVSGGDA
ncbi:MAG: hypothetical protein LBQ35_04890 [Spirochaetaceae bacterium]|jgi:hypothetical protein|nr:hypothetical protein [Spirochaetaceae bacterium]